MQALEEPKKLNPVKVDEYTTADLKLNDNGDVEIPHDMVIGTAADIFGDKVYSNVDNRLTQAVSDIKEQYGKNPDSKRDELAELRERLR